MKKFFIFLSVVVLLTTLSIVSTFASDSASASSYTVSGEWVFNETITKTVVSEDVNFTYNGSYYQRMWAMSYSEGLNITPVGSSSSTYIYNFEYKEWGTSARIIDFGDTEQVVSADFYNFMLANATPPAPPKPTECDGSMCPVGDANHDNYCDDCGLPMVYNLRSTLLDYAHSQIDLALEGPIPSGKYWLIEKAVTASPNPDWQNYNLYISADKFYLDGDTLKAGTGSSLVHKSQVWVDSITGDFKFTGWSSADTGNHHFILSNIVDSSHGTSFFFPIPLWMEMEEVGEQTLTQTALPAMGSTMMIVTVSSVGLLALVTALILLSRKLKIFLKR